MRKSARTDGLAAIIDSLMFVCIVSAIALLIVNSPNGEETDEPSDQSVMIHSVLIHGTISMGMANGSEAPVPEFLHAALASGEKETMERLSDRLGPISDALVEEPYHYRWVVTGMNGEIAMGEDVVLEEISIMASKIVFGSDEGGFTSIFYLWIL